MGLPAHNLIPQLVVRLLDRPKSLVLVVDGRPQRLDLLAGARESLIPLSNGLLQRLDLLGQGPDASGRQLDLHVKGITLATNKSNVILELLDSRQKRCKVLVSLGRILLGFGHGVPSLCRLFPERCVDNAKLIHLGALLG
jgi:hypothetical protein